MSTFLHDKFIKNLNYKFNFKEKSSILVAISGGQDSLCLVKLILDIQNKFSSKIGIIHIDHQWRKDTVENTKHLINLLSTLQYNSYFYQIPKDNYSENEARRIRYQILLDTAAKYDYSFIATAHSSNDRLETFLHNILKGGNPDNLNSLIWNRKLTENQQLIRPLMNLQRTEIFWFCRYYYLPIWSDNTNIFYGKTRNRMRQEVIPYIKLYFQPRLEIQISKFLDYISSDSDYLKQNAIKLYLNIKHPYIMALNHRRLLQQHKSMQKRVIELFLEHNTHIHCEDTIVSKVITFLYRKINYNMKYGSFQIKMNNQWIYLLYD